MTHIRQLQCYTYHANLAAVQDSLYAIGEKLHRIGESGKHFDAEISQDIQKRVNDISRWMVGDGTRLNEDDKQEILKELKGLKERVTQTIERSHEKIAAKSFRQLRSLFNGKTYKLKEDVRFLEMIKANFSDAVNKIEHPEA